MPILQKGNSQYPFWGDTIHLITGLDPLGLQVTSEATYSAMLPGLSNLTNRLRYYGFYCWLLDFYFKKEKKGNQTEQYRFIRRAELLIAILMQKERKGITQITGSDFASKMISSTTSSVFDLAEGADKDGNEKVYWKFPSGAFGQYYFGALQALALAVRYQNHKGDIIFHITQANPKQKVSGQELADAFNENLTEEIKEIFYSCIKNGKLLDKNIVELVKYFSIDKVNPTTKEWQLYSAMLLDKDYPTKEIEEEFTFHRKNTIVSLLSTARQNNDEYNWQHYLDGCYRNKLTGIDNNTNIGWYCYQLNEYWQFACGIIFSATLHQLEILHIEQYLPKFINDLSVQIKDKFCAAENVTLEQYLKSREQNQTEDMILEEFTTNNKPAKNAKIGFDLLFQLYESNKQQLPQLKEYMSRSGILREGNMADGLLSLFYSLSDNLLEFITNFIHKNIIYRHQMVALRKWGNGTQATNKFVIDEQMIRVIDIFPPRWTSPRMNALRNLLSDLQVINEEGVLTDLHTKFVNQ